MNLPRYLIHLFEIACKSESTLLITGQTGTGKSAIARKIHEHSARKDRPFIVINLATLHEGTLESELFGHERGAFTGASQRRVGRFELAQGGTLFLDEVGELPLRLQARLLEFLQAWVINPIGSNREIRLNVRVMAATHKNLLHSIAKGEFREDLFHRLRVISIPMRSLSQCADEFDEILHFCLSEICQKLNRSILKISVAVAEKLENYSWPGNIRELRNILEFAVLSTDSHEIELHHLPPWFLFQSLHPCESEENWITPVLGNFEMPFTLDYQGTLEKFEKEYLQRALSRYGGKVSRTAQQIGMNKTTLLRRMKAYRIEVSW